MHVNLHSSLSFSVVVSANTSGGSLVLFGEDFSNLFPDGLRCLTKTISILLGCNLFHGALLGNLGSNLFHGAWVKNKTELHNCLSSGLSAQHQSTSHTDNYTHIKPDSKLLEVS